MCTYGHICVHIYIYICGAKSKQTYVYHQLEDMSISAKGKT